MKYLRYILSCCLLLFGSGACSSLGLTNEDAGHSLLASDVSVPANGSVVYTIERNPRTDPAARQYYKDTGVSRSLTGWFGFGGGPTVPNAGKASTRGGHNNGS